MNLRWILLAAVTLCVTTGIGSEEPTASTPIAISPTLPPQACERGGATRVSVVSRQNGTGHWLGDARVERAAHPGRSLAPLSIHLSHERRHCKDSASIVLHLQVEGPPEPARPDYIYFRNFGYYKWHTAKTWPEAKTICENEGAHLVILNSEREAELIKGMIPSIGGNILLGIHDILSEGRYMSVLGDSLESTGYVKWKKNEPNGKRNENCVEMSQTGEMNDINCETKFPFICEYSWE